MEEPYGFLWRRMKDTDSGKRTTRIFSFTQLSSLSNNFSSIEINTFSIHTKYNMKKLGVVTFLLSSFCWSAQAQTAPPYWQEMVAFKKQDSVQQPAAHAIVFVGSSSFTKWK